MEISNQVIATAVGALLMGGVSAGGIGIVKNSQLTQANVQVEEKKDLKFAAFEELCQNQLERCETRNDNLQDKLETCWTNK